VCVPLGVGSVLGVGKNFVGKFCLPIWQNGRFLYC